MAYYINGTAAGFEDLDFKNLVPDANMRRRMSGILKTGVSTAMECLRRSSVERVDAIITATELGCLADSEKFLRSIIENNEQMLNPTPFIQSTFNTIGGQIAILTGSHGYNVTYSHGEASFGSALLDAILLIDEGAANHILIGTVDETTETLTTISKRLRYNRPEPTTYFFILSSRPTESCLGTIEDENVTPQTIWDIIDKTKRCY